MPSFCAQCGSALEADARFCEECGAQAGGKVSSGTSHPKRTLLMAGANRKRICVEFLLTSSASGS